MARQFLDNFCWNTIHWEEHKGLTAGEKYGLLVDWAREARGKNPDAFDEITRWMLDDSQWGAEKLEENRKLFLEEFIGRFQRQNQRLRSCLEELRPSGVVNEVVFDALDRFEDELSGHSWDESLKEPVARMHADFSAMKDRTLRERIAGGVTGSFGTDTVAAYGHINFLKDCDASVQWALFMPDMVEEQQQGFRLKSLECKTVPAMRFVGFDGKAERFGEDAGDAELPLAERVKKMKELDALSDYASELAYDVLFLYNKGLGVDVEKETALWGRFMKAGCPVPPGFVGIDFVPERIDCVGEPYLSQFVYAVFEGDPAAMNQHEGYDGTAMYDVTRNTMLGQGITIPYPDKYWVAEVYLQGCDKPSTAYMFSAEL